MVSHAVVDRPKETTPMSSALIVAAADALPPPIFFN